MSHIDLNLLIRTLEPNLRIGLEAAASLAARHQHATVDISHWLRSLLDLADLVPLFEQLALPVVALRSELETAIDDVRRDGASALALSHDLLTLAREAWIIASLQCGRRSVGLPDLLTALTSEQSLRVVVRAIAPSIREIDIKSLQALLKETEAPSDEIATTSPVRTDRSGGDNEFLQLYTHDMTQGARNGRIDPVVGREGELRQVVDILTRRRQNNPILVGEAGVGKTAVAEALALEIAAGNVPTRLRDIRLLLLDLSLLQAGAGVKGEFERRLHGVINAVKKSSQPIILFIDEAHGLIGAGGPVGQGDAANILKPALARGELRTIAATTWSEYKRHIEKDTALTRRFQLVQVLEPDEAKAIQMLRGVAGSFAAHHKVRIRDEALAAAVHLSARYLPSRQLPDKAISLIDTAAAAVSLARQTTPEALQKLKNEQYLIDSEAAWLRNEPQTPEIAARLHRIESERLRLDDELSALELRLSDEMRLLREVDRIEVAFGGEATPPVTGLDDELLGANVAQLAMPELSAENARRTFAAAEAKLTALTGEAPLVPRVVDRDVVAGVVSRWTGIPVGKLLSDQVETVKTLEARLKERVIGQDLAIHRIASTMRAARAGLSDPRKPPAVFLLVGMSGTGKTETALALADILYGGSQHLTTLNMSEFKEEHKVSMLLGSPPGYVGYGEGGVLTEAVRRRPYGVLLLDEIDKAHPGVQEIFYQVFDKGTLRDGEGRDIDFKNTTIFMTANTGSELLAALSADPDTMPEGEPLEALLLPELQKQFKPAFLGRTTILPFMPLDRATLSGIVDIQIGRIRDRLATAYGTSASLSFEARDALITRARASDMGARAIEVVIGRDLLPVLSTFFLDLVADRRKVAHVEIGFDGCTFTVAAPNEPQTNPPEFALSGSGRANEAARDDDRPAAAKTRKATAP